MIDEVRRQFREIPGIMEGTGRPEYEKCVDISTVGPQGKDPPRPACCSSPVAVGFGLGAQALGGLLAGAIVTGVMLAIFMSNSGGAWDNAKKYIEEGNFGGKGTRNMQRLSWVTRSAIPSRTRPPEPEYPHKAHVGGCFLFLLLFCLAVKKRAQYGGEGEPSSPIFL